MSKRVEKLLRSLGKLPFSVACLYRKSPPEALAVREAYAVVGLELPREALFLHGEDRREAVPGTGHQLLNSCQLFTLSGCRPSVQNASMKALARRVLVMSGMLWLMASRRIL
ncbi:Uncharacterised protein [Segatella buccae]|uniref:Uncharacterized protein n=1 Tax=Segatella buccae TaxID=28126 RepID=A0AAQ1URG5_9BACT|nr:Uncharacterised protein [Segatella buccae]